MDRDATFGQLLRKLRKAHDLTQEALAQRVYCALDTIKKIKGGVRRPSRQLAAQFADCFGLAGDDRAGFLAAARLGAPSVGNPSTETMALWNLGTVARQEGDQTRAALLEESLAVARETGDRGNLAAPLQSLGDVVQDQGDYARAGAVPGECGPVAAIRIQGGYRPVPGRNRRSRERRQASGASRAAVERGRNPAPQRRPFGSGLA